MAAAQKNATQQLLETVTANNQLLKEQAAEIEKLRSEIKALTLTCTQTREAVEANKLQAGSSRTVKKATSTTEAAKKPDFPSLQRWISEAFSKNNNEIPESFVEYISDEMYTECKENSKKAYPAKNEKALFPYIINSLISMYLTKGNKQFSASAFAGINGLYAEEKKAYESS